MASFVLLTTLFFLPLFEYLPKAVCSSIIVVAACKLIEFDDIFFILRLRAWSDLGLLLLTFLSTIFIGIDIGTLISVGVSLLLVVKHTTRTRLAILGKTTLIDPRTNTSKTKFRSLHDNKCERIDGVLIVRIEETMFFGNVGQLKDRLKRIEVHGGIGIHPSERPIVRISSDLIRETNSNSPSPTNPISPRPPSKVEPLLTTIIFEMSAVIEIDARCPSSNPSATQSMLEIVTSYHSRNIRVCFVKLRTACKQVFTRAGITILCPGCFYDKLKLAVDESVDPRSSFSPREVVVGPASGGPGPDGACVGVRGNLGTRAYLPFRYSRTHFGFEDGGYSDSD